MGDQSASIDVVVYVADFVLLWLNKLEPVKGDIGFERVVGWTILAFLFCRKLERLLARRFEAVLPLRGEVFPLT